MELSQREKHDRHVIAAIAVQVLPNWDLSEVKNRTPNSLQYDYPSFSLSWSQIAPGGSKQKLTARRVGVASSKFGSHERIVGTAEFELLKQRK